MNDFEQRISQDRRCRWLPVLVALWAGCVWIPGVSAQQTIVNVPSDAQTPRGRSFFLHETQILPGKGREIFQTTNFYTYGLTDHTELALTLYNVDSAGSPLMALGFGFKSAFDVFEEALPEVRPRWTVGHMTPISLQPGSEALGYFTYTHMTFEIPRTDLRLLGGVAWGSRNLFGSSETSALAGAELPLTKHLSFTGEWFSGHHQLAALIPGLTYHRGDLIVVVGYKIPNDFDMEESGLVAELGVFFGGEKGRTPESIEEEEERRRGPQPHYGTRPPRPGRGLRTLFGF
ncbi:MAG: hypothetical protein KatS3mg108_3561 [Isosphaeraceae bacterium]|jgi:hypothetical protein|nr:MAG: hypothetical protein KatS3mg108_3561 [Isosphaeraceae bacterium]